MTPDRTKRLLVFLLFIEVAIGAFLLFQVQPLVAKILLPKFGGAASVWVTCAVFFQCALFLGYLFVDYIVTRIGYRRQILLFLSLLAVAALVFPLSSLEDLSPPTTLGPMTGILGILALGIGVPFAVLSMTSSLSHHWLFTVAGKEPYRLYALSNGASFAALLSYPFFFEPQLELSTQVTLWQSSLWALTFVTGALLLLSATNVSAFERPQPSAARTADSLHVASSDRWFWTVTAGLGVTLLLATTHHLCADIAPVPLLWVVPLALYLATYCVAFGFLRHPSQLRYGLIYLLALLTFLAAALLHHPLQSMLAILTTMTMGCLLCHAELARSRPPPHESALFYRYIALGGALGGIFVGVVAPIIFSQNLEIVIGLIAPLIVYRWSLDRYGATGAPKNIAPLILLAVAAALVVYDRAPAASGDSRFVSRNFYGVLKVFDRPEAAPPYREFSHGSTIHGVQRLDRPNHLEPGTYYGPSSGIGRAFKALGTAPIHAAIIGLGVGTVATYAKPGDTFTFFEINPAVIEIARKRFTFTAESRGTVDIYQGDGRIELERWSGAPFDLVLLDAFSGDAIPTHLLTKEAITGYRAKLAPEGILVFHISNRFLDLSPVLATVGTRVGLRTFLIGDPTGGDDLRWPSLYVIMTNSDTFIENPQIKPVATQLSAQGRLWTDRYSSLWNVFQFPLTDTLGSSFPYKPRS